jgi:hypothetical protein
MCPGHIHTDRVSLLTVLELVLPGTTGSASTVPVPVLVVLGSSTGIGLVPEVLLTSAVQCTEVVVVSLVLIAGSTTVLVLPSTTSSSSTRVKCCDRTPLSPLSPLQY